jgi:hypothetical protein
MLVFQHLMTDTPSLQVKVKPALAKVSVSLAAVSAARQSIAEIDSLRATVAKWRGIASDPTVSDESANAAAVELVRASEELRLAEIGIDRRNATLERAIALSAVVADEILSVLESLAFSMEREATATGFELCRKLIAPDAAALSVDIPQGAARESAIGGMVFFMRGVHESTDLLERVTNAMKGTNVMRAIFAQDLLERWDSDNAVIAQGVASMRAAIGAAV